MNAKKFWIGVVVIFFVHGILQIVIHTGLLKNLYIATDHLWKDQAIQKSRMFVHLLADFFFALLFCFIYVKGFEPNKAGGAQGIRYGLYMGLFVQLPLTFTYFVVLNAPGTLLVWWFIYGLLVSLICGGILGAIYKPQVATS
ncbi:MAG: hypothetical protein RBG1_1C00001G1284 [candidate division Zixibacteria bacterium RBG-1]|nr:MAG: hypothetical protein RBG1_1C00001G1284 [candidate division Zixibacteria bacterium RBG-1]OGC86710.1 MAG: hypothetical protein A2V73_06120 [candidate division Zixibacteria bacterium RBG_19FT_COMBO_42_43]